jgi:enamine deaminase RidA (YjgF/YER057c/UK114 family)
MNKKRRVLLKTALGAAAVPAAAMAQAGPGKKVHYRGKRPEGTPLYSPAVSYGNLLFLSGKGGQFEGDIKAHTKHVLDELQQQLENAGSSMEKALKVTVFLNDIKYYQPMNEVYRGRFGENPPVRTTVAVARVPGISTVEIDVIAYI